MEPWPLFSIVVLLRPLEDASWGSLGVPGESRFNFSTWVYINNRLGTSSLDDVYSSLLASTPSLTRLRASPDTGQLEPRHSFGSFLVLRQSFVIKGKRSG